MLVRALYMSLWVIQPVDQTLLHSDDDVAVAVVVGGGGDGDYDEARAVGGLFADVVGDGVDDGDDDYYYEGFVIVGQQLLVK